MENINILKNRAVEFGGDFHKTIDGDSWYYFSDSMWAKQFFNVCKSRKLDVEVMPNQYSNYYWVVVFGQEVAA